MEETTDLKPTTLKAVQDRKAAHKEIVDKRISELGPVSWIPGIRRVLSPFLRSNLARDLRIKRLRENAHSLRESTHTDQLTQIPNETAFKEMYEREIARTKRTGRSMVLVYGDIDGFKGINDQYGHDSGDKVLRAAAVAVRSALRPYDTTARISSLEDSNSNGNVSRLHGDEFAILLPETDVEHAYPIWNRLKKSLSKLNVRTSTGTIKGIQMSAGAILVNPEDSAEASLMKADQIMYKSKKEGLGNLHGSEVTS